jgi:hypothetical protein
MMRFSLLCCVAALLIAVAGSKTPATGQSSANVATAPVYTGDGKLVFPPNYREWIYLTTGLNMDYSPTVNLSDHSMFDNVFVNPEAYRAFVATGKWPDKTVFVLEGRVAGSKGSINKGGHYQTTEIMSRSIHLKDESRGGWAFFGFGDGPNGGHIPKEAVCYSCHADHGAVDTTFVQFYPTLLDIARQKGTLSPSYLKDEAAMADKK